ncbi:hypothetical protein A2Y83_00795 [Candidatus Falkowbacteria bacterium RBG_13_39_14]|uniref:Uncharacterized protein n=1 Tax=Candidatus Falkowbacteria bacterium RBG_13_39_14 TaxID=1797985 RepID=A0A1F5S2N8_9BACT|nr:MAG: hypothetical protein A2Y83_00795 [Candidatus Falkowbacteria bacterium RBG_13_39_14]
MTKFMVIIRDKISLEELKKMAEESFGDFVKVVVDIDRKMMAIGGELHADGEALLLKDGSVLRKEIAQEGWITLNCRTK